MIVVDHRSIVAGANDQDGSPGRRSCSRDGVGLSGWEKEQFRGEAVAVWFGGGQRRGEAVAI
jgi:hypothetical protein